MEEQASDAPAEGVYNKAKASRFRFKSGAQRSSNCHDKGNHHEDSENRATKHRGPHRNGKTRRSHRDRRRRHHQRTSQVDQYITNTRDGEYYDPDHRYRESLYDDLGATTASSPRAGPDDAFRESLFDALADDEGAAYWEGVYGQPVHVYPIMKPGPDGKLERMNEEEYAEYVRTKMWEKSHQHILEEREAREKSRQKKKDQQHQFNAEFAHEEAERETIRQRMQETLRRGEERKKIKAAQAAWDMYLKKWDDLKTAQNDTPGAASKMFDVIPWPVVSGKASHVSKEEIERFLRGSSTWKDDSLATLKVERVRWHPDKIQQRFGKHIDADAMKLVTAVFQIVDRLWNDRQ
ncbi:hypothetical protein BKA66DRAFT_517265 [Pyrenochaeta sp. MPI-SDFR-AT-0127]|nr:hypothetical protein BKA66DRAFT_517265 [Pyrenochaeta sp. MPI-SDFR-AT-0127]